MKTLVLAAIGGLLIASCSQPKTELRATKNVQGTVIGDSIPNGTIINSDAILTAVGKNDRVDMKIKGKVEEVCQKKGCWMTMKLSNGETMRITFKDYKLFMPKDISGKEVILDGFAFVDTVSVKDQKHYAEDGGKSEAEIAKITKPKTTVSYEAKGVVIL